jgi:hypothetical protein
MMRYMRGFYKFDIRLTCRPWGTFTRPVWARDAASAIALINRKYRVRNARLA